MFIFNILYIKVNLINLRKFALLLVVAVMTMTASYVHADTRIKPTELPKTAQSFIAKHFPSYKIRKVEKDMGISDAEYEVDFFGGAEIENIARKHSVNAILSGNEDINLDEIIASCRHERLDNSPRAKIGF